MTDSPTRTVGYLRFLGWVVAVTAVVALLGYVPARRLAGEAALPALLAGCVIGIVASALGGVPIALAHGRPPAERMTATLAAMLLRLVAAVALGVAAVLSGWFARGPLLLWVAVCYSALLVVDTRYALGSPGTGKNVET